MSKLNELIEKLCPDGVKYKKFNDVATYLRGVSYSKTKEVNDGRNGYKLLRANNITLSSNVLNFNEIKVIDFSVNVKENQMLMKNDILICAGSGSKEHIGKVAFISENIDYTFGGFMGVIRCKSNIIHPRYMFHIMTSQIFKNHLHKVSNSSTINNINNDTWKDFNLPVPPMEVQCEIVRILDKLTRLETELETELEAELEARKKQYKFYLHRLLEVKEGVELTIGEIYDFKYGTGNTIPSEGGKYPVYGSNGKVGYCKEYNSEDAPVIGHIGAYAGIVNWAEGKHFVTYNGVICKYKNKMVNKRYAYYLLLTQDFIGEQKGAQPFVSYDALRKPVVRIPNIEIQKSIVEKLDKLDKLCNDISECLPAEIEARQKQYEYYRDKLLTFKELKVNE